MAETKCSICGGMIEGYGNSALPVNDGRCCDKCNGEVVVPRRANDAKGEKEKLKLDPKKVRSNENRAKRFTASILKLILEAEAIVTYEFIMHDCNEQKALHTAMRKHSGDYIDDLTAVCKKYLDADSCRIVLTKYSEMINEHAEVIIPLMRSYLGAQLFEDILLSCAEELISNIRL